MKLLLMLMRKTNMFGKPFTMWPSLLYQGQDIQEQLDSRITFGQKVADEVAVVDLEDFYLVILLLLWLSGWGWTLFNPLGLLADKYPFILLNLALSTQRPFIDNDESESSISYDRLQARNDFSR